MISDSPALEDSDVSGGLLDSLGAAEDALSAAKQQNRDAIRNMNRQMRVGAAKLTPNIVLITVPELQHGDLDRLPDLEAARGDGVLFTNFYPASNDFDQSRWSLMTGQFATRAPRDGNSNSALQMPEVLWKAGYQTSFVGAWTQKVNPGALDYEHWTAFPSLRGLVDPYPEYIFSQSAKVNILKNQSNGKTVPASELLLNEAVTSIETLAQQQRQFFLHVSVPWDRNKVSDSGDPLINEVTAAVRESIATHRIERSTCILIMGETLGTATHNEAMRTPLIAIWPGNFKAGGTNTMAATTVDVLPTLHKLVRARHRIASNGISLAQNINSQSPALQRLLYWKFDDGRQFARRGDWKLVLDAGSKTPRLYNLKNDPSEEHDIAADNPSIVQSFIRPPAAKPTSGKNVF